MEPLDLSNTKDQCNKCCDVNMYEHKEVVFYYTSNSCNAEKQFEKHNKKAISQILYLILSYKCSICDIDEKHLKTSFSSDFREKGIWIKNIEFYRPVH